MKYLRITVAGIADEKVDGIAGKKVEASRVFEFDIEKVRNRCTVPDASGRVELLTHIMSDFLLEVEMEMCEMMRNAARVPTQLKQKGVISKV
jgi:hypothetical protein